MPDTRDFLSRVLPWPTGGARGYVNTHVHLAGKDGRNTWTGRPHTDIDDFINQAHEYSTWTFAKTADVYMCMSRQRDTKAPNAKGLIASAKSQTAALAMKGLFVDLDVGPKKGYKSKDDAKADIGRFCSEVGIPGPTALVDSGGGIHAHWISDKELTVQEWQKYADGLKALAAQKNLRIDPTVPADSARILRVPGTYNCKTEPKRPVILLTLEPDDHDFAATMGILLTVAPAAALPSTMLFYDPTVFAQGACPAEFIDGTATSLQAGIEAAEAPPINLQAIADAGCGFVKEALETGGKDFSQGLWNLGTLLAVFAEDGNALAHKMAAGHSGYTHASTEDLWNRKVRDRAEGKGWPGCAAIQSDGCTHCATCPHLAAGKTPGHLSRVSRQVGAVQPYATRNPKLLPPSVLGEGKPDPLTDDELPYGYMVEDDKIYTLVAEKAKGMQGTIEKRVYVIKNQMFAPWLSQNGDNWFLHFVAGKDKGNYDQVTLPWDKLGPVDLVSTLHRQGVLVPPATIMNTRDFFVSWSDMLRNAGQAQTARSMGWCRDANGKITGFSYGGIVYNTDGTSMPIGNIDTNMRHTFVPRGDIQHWRNSMDIILAMKRPGLECLAASGFGSPLMTFTGQYNGMLSVHGESGSGKSTAARLAMAVWSSPKLTCENPSTTLNSVLNRMGQTQNLPMCWDELTDQQSLEKVFNTLFIATLGAEGGRLFSNITQRRKGEWQQLSMVCSNDSFGDYITKRNGGNKAGLVRIVEYRETKINRGDPGHVDGLNPSRMHGMLDFNYGHMGMALAPYLAQHHEKVSKMVSVQADKFYKLLKLEGDERFWGATCACIVVGAKIANAMFQVGFDTSSMEKFLCKTVENNRERTTITSVSAGTMQHTEDTLSAFLNSQDVIRGTLRTGTALNATTVSLLDHPAEGWPMTVHWELPAGPSPAGSLLISQAAFRNFLMGKNINLSYTAVVDGLRKHFGAKVHRAVMGARTKYTSSFQIGVIQIPIPPGSSLSFAMTQNVSSVP